MTTASGKKTAHDLRDLLRYEYLRSKLFVDMSEHPSSPPPRPTDGELEILTVLWSRGPSTVREVHETINRRKPAHYTTVLKLMQIMADKGLVRRDEKQRAHIYETSRPREWTQRQLAGDLLQRAFEGSAKSLILGALSARRASRKELTELRKILEEYEKESK
jgi:predicted transcriptional regulator